MANMIQTGGLIHQIGFVCNPIKNKTKLVECFLDRSFVLNTSCSTSGKGATAMDELYHLLV